MADLDAGSGRERGFGGALRWNAAGTMVGQVAGLALGVVLARALPDGPLTAVLTGVTFATLASQAFGLAIDRVGVVALTRARQHRGALARGIVRIVLVASVLAAAVAILTATVAPDAVAWSEPQRLAVLVALLTGAEVVRSTLAELPRAWLRVRLSVLLGTSGRSVLVLLGLLLAAAFGGSMTATEAMVAFAAVSTLLAVGSVLAIGELAGRVAPDRPEARRVARGGLTVMPGTLARALIEQADVLVVAAAFDARVAAGYAIAGRVANAISGATITINLTVLPLLGRAADAGDGDGPEQVARTGATLASLVVLPVCAALALFAPAVLGLVFGDDLRAAAPVLRILLLGQAVNAVTGVAGAVLLDAGRRTTLLIANVAWSVVTMVAMVVASGGTDARLVAVANVVGFAGLNLSTWVLARRLVGVRCDPYVRARAIREHVLPVLRARV